MGPDGAIYIADWYNPIIQHGEVDFRDPRRDHTHGRIWRVTAKGRPTGRYAHQAGRDDRRAARPAQVARRMGAAACEEHAEDAGQETPCWPLCRSGSRSSIRVANYEHHLLEALWVHRMHQMWHPMPVTAAAGRYRSDHRVRAAASGPRSTGCRAKAIAIPKRGLSTKADRDGCRQRASARPPRRRARPGAVSRICKPRELAASALDKPMDRWLDFAVWQAMRDLAPVWLPAVKEGQVRFRRQRRSPGLRPEGGRIARGRAAAAGPASSKTSCRQIAYQASWRRLPRSAAPRNSAQSSTWSLRPIQSLPDARKATLLTALVETSRLRKTQPAGDLSRVAALFDSQRRRRFVPLPSGPLARGKLPGTRDKLIELTKASGGREASDSVTPRNSRRLRRLR